MLFGINFAMGVATGITMEFQFGTNWAYYAHYVGDIFGVPLAIEGLMAFFLESTFVGLFFFGWNRLTPRQASDRHLARRDRLQSIGAVDPDRQRLDEKPGRVNFNYQTMRMEVAHLHRAVQSGGAGQVVHTVSAGYVTAAMFVLGVSSWYLLKRRDTEFALRSFAIAAGFGLASTLCVIMLGDESGYPTGEVQKVKLAAIESEWETRPGAGTFTVFGIPNQKEQRTDYAIRVPYALGIIATRSLDEPVIGLKDLITRNEARIKEGMVAYAALQKLKQGRSQARTKPKPSSTITRTISVTARCSSRSPRT